MNDDEEEEEDGNDDNDDAPADALDHGVSTDGLRGVADSVEHLHARQARALVVHHAQRVANLPSRTQ
jgi:hypothetical protein